MKKAVVASLMAFSSVAPLAQFAFSQQQASPAAGAQQPATGAGAQQPAAGAAAGQVQMPQAEYNVYNAAINQSTPQTKAPALEAYLQQFPNSTVKSDVLQQLMVAYSSFDPAKTLDAADRLLQVDPNNLRAITLEVYFRKASADQLTDATAKQAALDKAAEFAQKGLVATKPTSMSDADFKTLQTNANPIFYSAIGTAALNKKDAATAITNFKQELAAVPVDQTTKPGPILQDTYFLGLAYLQSTPPDYINCTFYVTRFTVYAPEPYKSQMMPTAQYCYKKYHGNADGYDKVTTAATANLNPPSDFSITPAPKASDIAHQTVASTSDLGTLALSDKEFILQNGTSDDAEKVWATVKGKTVEIPDATVISATDSSLAVAVSDDAVQSKTADFTFNMKEPLKTVPTVGSKVSLTGTYASYSQGGSTPAAATATTPAASTTTTTAPASADATATATTPVSPDAATSAPTTTANPTPAPAGTQASATTPASAATQAPAAGAAPGPLMITMSDGAVATKAAPRRSTTPARRTAPTRRR